MSREATLVGRMMREVRGAGGYVVKLHGGAYQAAGMPDLLVVHGGRVLFVEAKCAGNRLSPVQEQQIGLLRAAGGEVMVLTAVEPLRRWLESE